MIEVHYVLPDRAMKVRHLDGTPLNMIEQNTQSLGGKHYILREVDRWEVVAVDNGDGKSFPLDQFDGAVMWARHRQ